MIKKNTLTLAIMANMIACQPKPTQEDAPQTQEATAIAIDYYGDQIDSKNVIEMAEVKAELSKEDSVVSKLQGTIVQTCKMKGCWMKVAMPAGDTIRVTFKDYGFFVPKSGVEGKQVVFSGTAKKNITSVETLQHYAKDGGASEEEIAAITQPLEEINFVANGVMISNQKIEN